MQKKILLKKTREYLQNSFPENLLPTKKLRQNKKKLFFYKTRNLKTQIIKAKKEVFNQYANSTKKLFALKDNLVLNKNITYYNPKIIVGDTSFLSNEFSSLQSKPNANYTFSSKNKFDFPLQKRVIEKKQTKFAQPLPPFLFSTNQIQYELSRKNARSSDFKKQLKERKKLALIYGHLSKKYIKKVLKQAAKLNGKKHDNFFFLLEARLDVVLFRACFFSSIKSARQWINHNKILVNNQLINTSSYKLKPGDIISIKPKNKLLLCKQIKHFLKKSFFKQNKNTSNQFIISMFLFKKLKSLLKSLAFAPVKGLTFKGQVYQPKVDHQGFTNPFLINHFKKNYFQRNNQALLDKLAINQISSLGKPVRENFITNKVCNKITSEVHPNYIINYKQFLFQVKQVLRSILNKYSKKSRYFKNNNSFALNLSQAEKNTLISNLIELESLEKKNLAFGLNVLDSCKTSNSALKAKVAKHLTPHPEKATTFGWLPKRQGNQPKTNFVCSVFTSDKPSVDHQKGKQPKVVTLTVPELGDLESLRGFLIHLKLKKLFFKSEKKKKSFSILNQNVLKPLNLEISYKNLMIIYLYSPQKIPFACSINMELISRSLA